MQATAGPAVLTGDLAQWWRELPHGTKATTLREALDAYRRDAEASTDQLARAIVDEMQRRGLVTAAGDAQPAGGEVAADMVEMLGF